MANQKTNVTLLLTAFALALIASSMGCRTGGFSKPDMSKLAFWKSENSIFASKTKTMPPPPARHFDPSPIEGGSQLASSDSQRYKNDITEMRAEIDAAAQSLGTPIRKPYSSDTESTISKFASNAGSSFEAQAGNVNSKLDGYGSNAASKLDSAQDDFQAAMNSSAKKLNNDFAAKQKSANDLTSGWKNDLDLPGRTANVKNKVGDTLSNVNSSLYDVNGKLASSSDQAVNQFNEKVRSLNDSAATTANNFQSNAKEKINQFAQSGNSFAPISNSNQTQDSGFGGSIDMNQPTTQGQSDLGNVQAQMAEAKRQIEELKQQVAMATQKASAAVAPPESSTPFANGFQSPTNSFAPMTPTANDRVAQLQTPGVGQFKPADVAVANPLRSNGPLQPRFPNTSNSVTPPTSTQPNTSGYPATSHGQYAPRGNDFGGNFSPQSPMTRTPATKPQGAHVGFESGNDHSMVATADQAMSPSIGASKIENYVSEVEIPDSILRGNGSYAPGSVQPLRSNK